MPKKTPQPTPQVLDLLEQAALRNAPLSVGRPEHIGKEPMARGRFLMPEDGMIVVENLQVPGRSVDISVGCAIDAFFQHEGDVYQFRSKVLEMDTPVRLNEAVMVRGVRIATPERITKGNRRQIYRQSFASVNPRVKAEVWAVPRDALNAKQFDQVGKAERAGASGDYASDGGTEFLVERGDLDGDRPHAVNAVSVAVDGLKLTQLTGVMDERPNWQGEIADASEFGLGLVVHDVVYSRLKVFQPLLVRFRIPEVRDPLEFLFEIRRVQELKDGARLGGILLVNSTNAKEIQSARALAQFALQIQRDRVRNKKAA